MFVEVADGLQPDPLTEVQRFFLKRLDRLVRLEEVPAPHFDAARLLHRAIYSTYADCRDLGVGEPAREILAHLRAATTP